ncbi:hypothetical protein IA69_15545 [Massilia sp. JS1662]|nr:hypothetical protein [Massilia sp. JS1662]KGF80929.1 hypothetical protein IA69_15545 [Massilia sp. JS1662]
MEQVLARFGRFVNDMEDNRRGDAYIHLAWLLLESRRGGPVVDHAPGTAETATIAAVQPRPRQR